VSRKIVTDPIVVEDDEFDLDAVAHEAAKSPMRFKWQDQHWTFKHMGSVDWRVIELAQAGDLEAIRKAFQYGMGREQAARFDEVDQDAAAMVELFKRWTNHAGVTEGESSASATSSEPTAELSRPASQRTTRASGSRTSGKARSPRAS
jgi:hypothetical protein